MLVTFDLIHLPPYTSVYLHIPLYTSVTLFLQPLHVILPIVIHVQRMLVNLGYQS